MASLVSLGDLVEIKHGFAFSGTGFSADPQFPTLLTPGNFSISSGFQASRPKTFTDSYDSQWEVSPGSAIVTMTDLSKAGDTLGNWAIVPNDGVTYLHNQRIGHVVLKREDVNLRYLTYRMRLSDYHQFVLGMATGTTVRHTSPSRILMFKFPMHEYAEQCAIAEVLGAMDDKIAANSSLVATLEERLRAVFRATIQDGSAARSLREVLELNPPRLKPSGVAPEVPMQALPSPGITIGTHSRAMPKGGARFINGDTLLARITPCLENGKTGYVGFLEPGEVGYGSTEYIVMRSREGYPLPLSYFIATDASFRREAIQRMVGSSGRQRLKASDIADLMMPITDDADRLSAFGVEVDNQFPLAQSLTDESNTLAQLRDTLLPALMDGRLRVRDSIGQVEGVL